MEGRRRVRGAAGVFRSEDFYRSQEEPRRLPGPDRLGERTPTLDEHGQASRFVVDIARSVTEVMDSGEPSP